MSGRLVTMPVPLGKLLSHCQLLALARTDSHTNLARRYFLKQSSFRLTAILQLLSAGDLLGFGPEKRGSSCQQVRTPKFGGIPTPTVVKTS